MGGDVLVRLIGFILIIVSCAFFVGILWGTLTIKNHRKQGLLAKLTSGCLVDIVFGLITLGLFALGMYLFVGD